MVSLVAFFVLLIHGQCRVVVFLVGLWSISWVQFLRKAALHNLYLNAQIDVFQISVCNSKLLGHPAEKIRKLEATFWEIREGDII